MSRVGKQPIPIPQGIEVKVDRDKVLVKGPKGQLELVPRPEVEVVVENGQIEVRVEGDDKERRAFHGLTRALINNMVIGVSQGYKKELRIFGIGYRATVDGNVLVLSLGHSHPINYKIPDGIAISAGKTRDKITPISIEGYDKQKVGQVAAEIRAFRPVEPYRGKGVRYLDEHVRRKVGKTAM